MQGLNDQEDGVLKWAVGVGWEQVEEPYGLLSLLFSLAFTIALLLHVISQYPASF